MEKITAMLISDKESIIVRSIEMKLTEMKFHSVITKAKIERIEAHRNDADLFIIYLPDEISDDLMKSLVYLADYSLDSGKPIVLIGEVEMKGILVSRLKKLGEYLIWFDRPLDIEDFGFMVKRAMEKNKKQSVMKRILIVDDDPNYAKMVAEWLKDSYRVDIVASGAQSLTFLTKNKVDLILLDYEMPIVDGPQVLQMLREDQTTASIPVIFLTGVDKKESVAKVIKLKPQGYVLKSATKSDLLVTIREFFNKR